MKHLEKYTGLGLHILEGLGTSENVSSEQIRERKEISVRIRRIAEHY